MSNTITAYFKGRKGVAESIYQNDYGMVMVFDGIELPAHFDCYFSIQNQEEAVPGVGVDNRVAIPNSVLANPGKVTIHIPLHTGANDSEVEYVVYFRVIGRARPVDDGTPAQMTSIEQALALLQTPIENIEQIVNEALDFTGDTFAEMQEQLDADQAAFEEEIRGDIADVESDFDNLNAQFQTAVGALTVDSEVQNIRVAHNQVTFPSAGEAVRGQLSDLSSETNKLLTDGYLGSLINSFTTASGWKLNDSDGLSSSNSSYKLIKYRVTAGDIICVTDCDRYQFQNAEGVPSSAPSNKRGNVHINGEFSIVPTGASYLIVSALTSASPIVKKYSSRIPEIDLLKEQVKYESVGGIPLESGSYRDEDGTTQVSNVKRARTIRYLNCNEYLSITSSSTYPMWVFKLDEDLGKLGTLENWVTEIDFTKLGSNVAYVNIVFKYGADDNVDISGNLSDIMAGITAIKRTGYAIEQLETKTRTNRTKLDNLTYQLNEIGHTEFEYGELYVGSDGGTGTYYNSTTRIRTIENHPITLEKGDIIGLSDYSNAVYNCRKKIDSTHYSYVTGAFVSQDWFISESGEYEILIRYPVESTISDVESLGGLFQIKKHAGTVAEQTNIRNLTDIYNEELKATIEAARAKSTSRCLMFGVVTDTHLDNKRVGYYNQTMENLERLNNGLQFNGIFHLGDIINGYDTADIAKFHLQYAVDRLLKINPQNTYITFGNHDNNNGAGDAQRLKDYELYSYIQRYNEHYVNRTMDATSSVYDSPTSNYYVDYPSMKIRMIMFDSCYYTGGFSDDMIAWMSALLASTPSDYHFVFFTHESTEALLNGGTALGNAAAFKALLAQYKDRIYCYIHGHSHYDYVGYDNEFVQIALCCAVPDQPSSSVPSGGVQPSRTIGSVTQDCISVIIILPDEQKVELVRFGAGSDMTIPFRQ